ncbi:MAG: HAD hydrolase family protein [Actinobacteria bacterium]|nr:HAD hydrolase family protein [Actinomycetota bacterium]
MSHLGHHPRMVVALDVDGTLYDGTEVADAAVAALRDAHRDGHVLLIVTGRRSDTLADVVPAVLPLCTMVVAEEGGVLVDVATGATTLLAPPIDEVVVAALTSGGVTDLDVGRVAVGADRRFETAMRTVHRTHAPNHEVVVNKGSVALVPQGCDKGTGLRAALELLGCSTLPVLAIGDAANDLPMFAVATFPVAVANADADVVAAGITLMEAPFGAGVAEALRRFLVP